MSTVQNPEEHTFTYVAQNGDIIRDVSYIQTLDNRRKRDFVKKYVNGMLVSTTITDFLDGYKDGVQHLNKTMEDGTNVSFVTRYSLGFVSNN